MVQGGDPTGSGKGGKSIYPTPNGKFSDEIVESLRHHKRGIVSMANSACPPCVVPPQLCHSSTGGASLCQCTASHLQS